MWDRWSRKSSPSTGSSTRQSSTTRGNSDSQPEEPTRVFVSTSAAPRGVRNWREWLGTFIDAFRSRRIAQLERDLKEQRDRNLLLEGQIMVYRSQGERDRELADTAIANERTAYQSAFNVDFQRKHGVVPFPEAPHIPLDRGPIKHGPVEAYARASDIQGELTAKFKEEMRTRYGGQS